LIEHGAKKALHYFTANISRNQRKSISAEAEKIREGRHEQLIVLHSPIIWANLSICFWAVVRLDYLCHQEITRYVLY
jgi:hypothetical protein